MVGTFYGLSHGYVYCSDASYNYFILTPEGKILSSIEDFATLPADLRMPERYYYGNGNNWLISDGFISSYMYNNITKENMALGYISLDGTKQITEVKAKKG